MVARLSLLLLFLVVTGLTASAGATTILRVPLDELTRGSDLVIQARVAEVAVETAPGDERQISTRVRLDVMEVFKGHHSAPTLTLRLTGGSTGLWTLHIPGMPRFRAGEEVVVFLEATRDGFTPAGLSAGKYTVMRNPAEGNARVRRHLGGVTVVERAPSGQMEKLEAPLSHPDDLMDLDELLGTIREAVRSQGGAL